MASEQDVSYYVNRGNVRVTQSMLGGDPGIGSEAREAERLHRGGSGSYIHASDLTKDDIAPRTGPYLSKLAIPQFSIAYKRGE